MSDSKAVAHGGVTAQRAALDGLFTELDDLLAGSKEAPQGEDDARGVLDQQLHSLRKEYAELKSRHDEGTLSVAVLATMKAGKSTLLNSLFGTEVLPASNVAETARIVRIVHDPADEEPRLLSNDPRSGKPVHGAAEVRACIAGLNSMARGAGRVGGGGLGGDLCVSVPIVALKGRGQEFGKLTLLDTPGPNEAGEAQLQQEVERLLNSIDCVLYVLDYTKLKTKDEEELLTTLSAVNPQLLERLSSRLFFVINKADEAEASGGLTADKVRHYVADLISRQLGGAGAAEASAGAGTAPPRFSLSPTQVLPVSARNALLARQVLSGTLDAKKDAETMKRFLNRAFGQFGSTRPYKDLPVSEAATALLEGSGIPEMESSVLGFLSSNASAIKLLATLDYFVRFLCKVRNVALTCDAALHEDVDALKEKTESLQAEFAAAVKSVEGVRVKTDELGKEVEEEIRKRFEDIQQKLHAKIGRSLSKISDSNSGGGWAKVQNAFKSLVGRAPQTDRETLDSQLKELFNAVMLQLKDEVDNFWGDLERNVSGRHAQLIEELNGQLGLLAGRVEDAVAEQLNVNLEAADISIKHLTPKELHADVQELVRKGVNERQELRSRIEKRTVEKLETRKKDGFCGMGGGYYDEKVQSEEDATVEFTQSVFSLDPAAISGYFIELVDTAIDNSKKVLSAFVRGIIEKQVVEAKSRIEDYGSRFLGALKAASDATKRGAAYRDAAREQVAACIRRLEDLCSRATQVQQQAAGAAGAALPGADGDVEAALGTTVAAAAAGEAAASSCTPAAAFPSPSSSEPAAGSANGEYSAEVPGRHDDNWTVVV